MAATSLPSTLNITKRVYGEFYERIPFSYTLATDLMPFTDKAKVGDTFRWLMELAMEHGATYNGTAGAAATLNAAIVGENKQADVSAYETHMRTRISTRAFEEALKKGDTAFESATRTRMVALQTAGEFRLEHSLLYGQDGICQVSAITSGVITVTDATWSSTMALRLAPGAVLEAWTAQTATATQHDGDLTVTVVDPDAKTITVSGTSSSVVANDWLYFKGARTATAHNEMPGLKKLMRTNSGTSQGIDLDTYSWARPNISSSIGRPTMLLILKAMRKLVGRNTLSTGTRLPEGKKGAPMDQNTTLWLPSVSYEILNSDLMSSRRFDGSYNRSKGTSGVQTIEYYGQTGLTSLQVHPLLRDGDAMGIGPDNAFRVGVTDIKWDDGPQGETDIWTKVADTTSYEARLHWIQAAALRAPGRTVLLTGLTE